MIEEINEEEEADPVDPFGSPEKVEDQKLQGLEESPIQESAQ